MSQQPPIPRPPGPALDKAPPPHDAHVSGGACEHQSGMSAEAFWGAVRSTIKREIIRLAKGTENVDDVYTLKPLGQKMVEDLIDAFKEGKTVPGLAAKENASEKCIMNWFELACFARWYAGDHINGDKREYIRQQLSYGVTAKELMQDEAIGENWYFCDGSEPEDEKGACCPADVLDDWYYQQLTQGIVPQIEPQKTSWLPIVFLGLGVFAVAMTVRAMSHHTQPNPSASIVPRFKPGKTPGEQAEINRRILRTSTAIKHSFEEWDEAREYLQGSRGGFDSHVTGVLDDLRDLVIQLKSIGQDTTDRKEIGRMLELSAGSS